MKKKYTITLYELLVLVEHYWKTSIGIDFYERLINDYFSESSTYDKRIIFSTLNKLNNNSPSDYKTNNLFAQAYARYNESNQYVCYDIETKKPYFCFLYMSEMRVSTTATIIADKVERMEKIKWA